MGMSEFVGICRILSDFMSSIPEWNVVGSGSKGTNSPLCKRVDVYAKDIPVTAIVHDGTEW